MRSRRLVLDVLLEIISFADMATQSRIMKTCGVLYREGGKQLLLRNEIEICNEQQLASFLRFMRADGHSRIPHLRILTLTPRKHMSKRSVEELVEFFDELITWNTGLASLSFSWTHDRQPMDARLAASVAQLTTLTDLSIDYVDHPTWAILCSMRSRLATAHIEFSEAEWHFNSPPTHELDLVRFLEGSRTTLKSMWVEVSNLTAIVTSEGPVYPRMEVLDIKPESVWLPNASHLLQAFPNLEVLDINDSNGPVAHPNTGSPECVALRAANRAYQRAHGSWQLLTYVRSAMAHYLYALAPTCRIEHLFLDEVDDTVDAAVLRDLLADARPTRLELGSNVNANFMKEDWIAALCAERTPQIEVLTIKMCVMGEVEEMGMEGAIEAMYGIVASLSLTAFHLEIQRNEYHPDDPWDTYGDLMDVQAVADRFMDSSSSMETALVTLDYEPSRSNVVARAGSRRKCARLFEY